MCEGFVKLAFEELRRIRESILLRNCEGFLKEFLKDSVKVCIKEWHCPKEKEEKKKSKEKDKDNDKDKEEEDT